jgi:hypothetical protein
MSRPGEPFDGTDFEDACEDCGAPPGALCRNDCPSGYSSLTREKHVQQIERAKIKPTTQNNLQAP